MEGSILMKAGEVAVALGVGRATAYEMMASGALPTVRIGRAVRVPRAGLEEWVRRQTTGALDSADNGSDAA
jgi:excisionase family DNA binding protein